MNRLEYLSTWRYGCRRRSVRVPRLGSACRWLTICGRHGNAPAKSRSRVSLRSEGKVQVRSRARKSPESSVALGLGISGNDPFRAIRACVSGIPEARKISRGNPEPDRYPFSARQLRMQSEDVSRTAAENRLVSTHHGPVSRAANFSANSGFLRYRSLAFRATILRASRRLPG